MEKEPSKSVLNIPLISILIGLLLLGTWYVVSGAPTQVPPGGNPAVPVSYWTLSGSNLYASSTSYNVGIATTTPGSPLTVAGVIYSSAGGFKFPDNTTQTTAASAGTNYWTLSGTSLYPTSTSYNVGIGTSTPAQKLSVVGTIESTSGGFKFPDATTQTTAATSSQIRTFTANGTWTCPAGVNAVYVTICGGGGGGGSNKGGGGAGICYRNQRVSVTGNVSVTVGAGGRGGSYGAGYSADPGGASSFGTLSAPGGGAGGSSIGAGGGYGGGYGGGKAGFNATNFTNGGNGGYGSGGGAGYGLNTNGGNGGDADGGIGGAGGAGAASYVGGGGGGSSGIAGGVTSIGGAGGTSGGNASMGSGYGSGGGGDSNSTNPGAAGTGGVVIVGWGW